MRMRYLLLINLMLIGLVTFAVRVEALDGWYTLTGIADVRDGDGINVDGKRLDIYGINAPNGFTPEGIAATDYLVSLVQGKTVSATCTDFAQGSQRPRCFITFDGQDVALMMLDNRHSRLHYPTMGIYVAAFRRAQNVGLGFD